MNFPKIPILFSSIVFSFLLIASACSSDEADGTGGNNNGNNTDCASISPSYSADIKPIIDASCATSGCHNAVSGAENIDLSTYAKVKDESFKRRFLGSINRESGFKAMPQGAPKLSDSNINLITCWIENGHAE